MITSPAQQARMAGLRDLNEVSNLSGISRQTLDNWSRDRPQALALLILGCKSYKEHAEHHKFINYTVLSTLD